MGSLTALDAVLPRLQCPICSAGLDREGSRVTCPAGHGFDIARQGYLNLAVGRRATTADSSAMVQARAQFLERGHFGPIADAVVAAVRTHAGSVDVVIDLAGGTGYYLAAVLDAPGAEQSVGACVDLAVPALRRAAGAHVRAASVGADAWQHLPLRDGSVDVLMSIFGPRNADEIERVLAPTGLFVVVAPRPEHLGELGAALRLIGIDPRKDERSTAAFARFDVIARTAVRTTMALTRADAHLVAAMGPSARHTTDAELAARVAQLPHAVDVTLAVDVVCHRRR